MNAKALSLDDSIATCALRFDGYKFAEARGNRFGPDQLGMDDFVDSVERSREFPEDILECHLVFFCMQRYLGKWGGEYLTEYSDEHTFFRLMFLHLYREEIPSEYREESWCIKWVREFQPFQEVLAGRIRRTLRRRGRGAKLYI